MRVTAYSTLGSVDSPPFGRDVARRPDDDPEMVTALGELKNYLWSAAGGQMSTTLFHVFARLDDTRWQIAFDVEPDDEAALVAWARAANALVLLPDGALCDPDGRRLVAPGGHSDPGAEVPYPPDAVARATRIRGEFAAAGLPVLDSLPPVVGESEVRLREAREVVARACALGAVAVRAEGLIGNDPIEPAEIYHRLPHLPAALSPQEAQFMADGAPPRQALINMCWRYEACLVLLWALGVVPTVPNPMGPCDAASVTQALFALVVEPQHQAPELRPTREILDELDREYRLHWAVVDARVAGRPVPGGLDEGVLSERRHALHWLTGHGRAEWDDVEIPT